MNRQKYINVSLNTDNTVNRATLIKIDNITYMNSSNPIKKVKEIGLTVGITGSVKDGAFGVTVGSIDNFVYSNDISTEIYTIILYNQKMDKFLLMKQDLSQGWVDPSKLQQLIDNKKINNLNINLKNRSLFGYGNGCTNYKIEIPEYIQEIFDNINKQKEYEKVLNENRIELEENIEDNQSSLENESIVRNEASDIENLESKSSGVDSEIGNINTDENYTNTIENKVEEISESSKINSENDSDPYEKIRLLYSQSVVDRNENLKRGSITQLFDVRTDVTEDTKNTTKKLSILDIYKFMIDNSHVGDELSIPNALRLDLNLMQEKSLWTSPVSTSKRAIMSMWTVSDSPSHRVIGVVTIDSNLDYFKFKVMNKPFDPNNISIEDIEVEWFKWSQSRKFGGI